MRQIPFSPPDITEAEIEEVGEALRSGWITTGKRTKLLEEKIAAFVGTSQAACLNSATAAMEMTLRILGVGPGDEVITSAYTYTASASVIAHVGAKIVLMDTAADSFEMDYEKLVDAITERTKVIIPVDLGGRMCDYQKIFAAVEAKRALFKAENDLQALYRRVIVMADSAHGFGSKCSIGGRMCHSGQVADFTCYSFHAVKNLTTGEGGAVTWRARAGLDDAWLYKQFMLYSLHGQNKDAFAKNQAGAWEYDIVYPAYKCNMTDTLAAIGLKQLTRYDGLLKRRRDIIGRYDDVFLPQGYQRLAHFDDVSQSSGHLYLLRIPGMDEWRRNATIAALAERGIAANVHYKPLPMMTAYKNMGFTIEDFPNAYAQFENEITLPLHTRLSDADVAYIAQNTVEAIRAVTGSVK